MSRRPAEGFQIHPPPKESPPKESPPEKGAVVCLIRIPSVVARFALTLNATPPISVAYLAGSLVAAGHETQIIDAVGEAPDRFSPGYRDDVLMNGLGIEDIVERVRPDVQLLGISCLFSHEWPVVRSLAAALRKRFPKTPIVLGGEHATAAPDWSLEKAPELDACALGEGEETVVDLARAVIEGRSLEGVPGLVVRGEQGNIRTAPRARILDIDEIPLPHWEAVPLEAYLSRGFSFGVSRGRTMPLLATRGCPYRCTFCSNPRMWTQRYVTRSPQLVVDEMKRYVELYGAENFDFYDLTAIVRREWILEFCELLLASGLDVTWQLPSGTRSEAIDEEVARLLYASGCRNISYAPESGSERVLAAIQKKVKLERMLESMEGALAAGLNVKANILVGFPDERVEDLVQTFKFVMQMAKVGVHDVSIWTFAPYPGSELFDDLRKRGRLSELDDDYLADLLAYSNLLATVSYSEHISPAFLERFRVGGMAAFYAASYALHPSRPLRSVQNLMSGNLESRLEMSLANLGRRFSGELKNSIRDFGGGLRRVLGRLGGGAEKILKRQTGPSSEAERSSSDAGRSSSGFRSTKLAERSSSDTERSSSEVERSSSAAKSGSLELESAHRGLRELQKDGKSRPSEPAERRAKSGLRADLKAPAKMSI